MNLISKQIGDRVIWGELIEPESYCIRNANSDRCKMEHQCALNGKFTQCHHGMSIFRKDENTVYFSMREKATYKKGKGNNGIRRQECYSPVMTNDKMLLIIEADVKSLEKDIEKNIESISQKNIKHEIKHLNAQIKDNSDLLMQNYSGETDEDIKISQEDARIILDRLRTIFVCSSMIMSRYTLDDYEKNPAGLTQGGQFPCTVYKKFDKICRILRNHEKKGVNISIVGKSYLKINAYQSFEFIPLLILENAVKYSLKNNSVQIIFEENHKNQKLMVTVNSFGPYCDSSELLKVFEKGFRGENAQKKTDGSGIGLFFVKILCDVHNIKVWAETDNENSTNISGIKYSNFRIKLELLDVFV